MALAGLEGRHEGRRQQNGTREPFGHAGVPPSLTSLAMNFSRSLASLAFAASAFCAAFASAAFCSSGVSTFSSAIFALLDCGVREGSRALLAEKNDRKAVKYLVSATTARMFSTWRAMSCARGLQSTPRSATPRS